MDTPVIHLSCVTHSAVTLTDITSLQINSSVTGLHLHLILTTREAHPNPSLSFVSPGLIPDLLKSVPVSWARMRKERDWVVPVRGCQSSVSWISLFLLRSFGIKQGRFSTLSPCLHTHQQQQHTAGAVNTIPSVDYPLTPTQLIR